MYRKDQTILISKFLKTEKYYVSLIPFVQLSEDFIYIFPSYYKVFFLFFWEVWLTV